MNFWAGAVHQPTVQLLYAAMIFWLTPCAEPDYLVLRGPSEDALR